MTRALDAFPRLTLAHLPTPLEPLPRLSAALDREIWIKRDDCTGLGLGGNKVRKLEYLLGAAKAAAVDTVITVGGVQSNHARQTAAAAARCGMRCQLVLPRVVPRAGTDYEESGNVLLDQLFGAEVFVVDDEAAAARQIQALLADAKAAGRSAVVHPPGGSTAIGALGYVRAAIELRDQIAAGAPTFGRCFLALGTGGTAAGLACGLRLASLDLPITAVCVAGDAGKARRDTEPLLASVSELLGESPGAPPEIRYDDRFLGEGYGVPSAATLEAVRLCARSEGLLLDPVYTGKAMAALVADSRGGADPGGPALFWHTGGTPALFAYRAEIAAAAS